MPVITVVCIAKYNNNYLKEIDANDKVVGFLVVNGWSFKAPPPLIEYDESVAILDCQSVKTFDFSKL